jgi:hypothetical protein
MHVNISAKGETDRQFNWRKLGCMVLAGVAPELIVTMAFEQRKGAREFVTGIRKLYSHVPHASHVPNHDHGFDSAARHDSGFSTANTTTTSFREKVANVLTMFRNKEDTAVPATTTPSTLENGLKPDNGVVDTAHEKGHQPIAASDTSDFALAHTKEDKEADWNLVHGFYCVSGGFCITPQPRNETFPINPAQAIYLLQNKYIEVPTITAHEIRDKSKVDALLKLLCTVQLTWFIIQCLGRWAQHLPTTGLEITTIAYVATTLTALGFWWRKPVDIQTPTELRCLVDFTDEIMGKLHALDPLTREFLFFWTKRNLAPFPYRRAVNTVEIDFYKQDEDGNLLNHFFTPLPNWIPLIGVAILYGAIHLIAWDFDFNSLAEKWSWRVAALITIAAALLTGLKGMGWKIAGKRTVFKERL